MCVCDETWMDGKKGTLCPLMAKSLAFGVKGLFFSGQQATHRECFLFKHKGCFKALKVNRLDLVVQMAQMTIFP